MKAFFHQHRTVDNSVVDSLGPLNVAWSAFGEVGNFFRRGEVDPLRVEDEDVGGHASAQEAAVVNAEDRRR